MSKISTALTKLALFAVFAAQLAAGAQLDRAFTKIQIPGATCGDGSPYYAYLSPGDSQKLLIHFQGGGACWNLVTCYGPTHYASMHDLGIKSKDSIFNTAEIGEHPFGDYTYLFVPYCTGDIFAGNHQARYGFKTVQHRGKRNTQMLLDFMESNYHQLVSSAKKLVVYGESAGAIGALLNLDLVSDVAASAVDKTVIADSPGLHFSDKIWDRFSDAYLHDISTALQNNGLELDLTSGLISKQMKTYCDFHSDWKIGLIQSTRDFVMSVFFGKRTESDHRAQVLGANGIDQVLRNPNDACSSWVPESASHVWALKYKGWFAHTDDGTVLKDYFTNLIDAKLEDHFSSHL